MDLFAKHIPNIKLATRFDADGNEIEVEVREDVEQNVKQKEICDILVAAGYFRARIKGLSPFDKIIGGMTWCIDACDFDVDVDLLFHENLSIGQKIALTEKIVVVLLKMTCPYQIEPHQIQGLDFINIFPVIQWLVKRSVENRAAKAEKLKRFAEAQFHNHFSLAADRETKAKNMQTLANVERLEAVYGPQRQYRRKEIGNEDETTRVKVTLLEYGNRAGIVKTAEKTPDDAEAALETQQEQIEIDHLLKNLSITTEADEQIQFTDVEKNAIQQHFADLKTELMFDSKEIAEQNKIKTLVATKAALDKKSAIMEKKHRLGLEQLAAARSEHDALLARSKLIQDQIQSIDEDNLARSGPSNLIGEIEALVLRNDALKQSELEFKEQCQREMEEMHRQIKAYENNENDVDLDKLKADVQLIEQELSGIRLKAAKKNRTIVSLQRQLDDVPDQIELAQYQRRFLELYNQMSAKHKETKQFYTLFNTLRETKMYLEKELSLLNSIYENFSEACESYSSKEQFVKQLEQIVEGVRQTKKKVQNRFDDEKIKRDTLNEQLMYLHEQQRKYANAVKQLSMEYQRHEALLQRVAAAQQF